MKKNTVRTIAATAALLAAAHASAQITFYENEGFRGPAFRIDKPIRNFERVGLNHHPESLVVERGRWQACDDKRFEGRCVILRPGNYASLNQLGLDGQIMSVRPAPSKVSHDHHEAQPLAAPAYEYRQRPQERLFEVPITSARAVLGPPEQRCWAERQQVQQRPDLNTAGGIIGGVLGGILGHQVGGGTGKTAATIGGAVGGAALGANVDRIRDRDTGQDVRRCENVASTTPQYWDVVYSFRGLEHRVQMTTQPGTTVTVNSNGEPRQ